MNLEEIKEKIDANNQMIEDLMTPNTFVLNNAILNLLKENERLQEQCTHKFEKGYCIYCYKQEN